MQRQTEESADNAFANAQGTNAERKGSNGQVQTSQTESARNKDKQKSNIIFGEESASESAAQNKKGQSSHGELHVSSLLHTVAPSECREK